jgi:hypothetical protein
LDESTLAFVLASLVRYPIDLSGAVKISHKNWYLSHSILWSEFDERDGELCLRHSFILGERWRELTTLEQRSTMYCNMFVLSHEMMESNWDVLSRLSSVKTDESDGEDEETAKPTGNALFVADIAINEGEDLAEGTLGNVARATLRGSEEHCVVKHLNPRKNFTEEDKETFKQEALAAHRLFHPNLVPIRAVCVEPPQMVEPFYETGSLAKLLESNKATRLPASRIFHVILDIARGVNYMHECGTTHSRLRPQNVLLSQEGVALVSDYGFPKTRKVILDGNTGPGDSGALYAAPEVLFGKPTSAGTDVFSIGIMLFQFLMPDAELLPPVVPELIAFGDGFAPEVEKLVRDCLHRDATKRPAVIDIIPILKRLAEKV